MLTARLPASRLAALVACAFAACGGPDELDDEPEFDADDESFLADGKADAAGVREGTAEAFAILRAASDTAEATLAGKSGVNLGKTTAAAIAKYRTGKDGRAGTADDQRFERLTELDAVKNVGPLAFGRLLAYAKAKGLVTKAQAVCGTRRSTGDVSRLPDEVRAAASDVRLRTGTDRLEIYANDSARITDRAIEELRLRVCLALEFDLTTLAQDPSVAALAKPYRIVVMDHATYDRATEAPGTDGLAFMKTRTTDDAFLVPSDGAADAIEFDDTLAHELLHLIVGRLAPNDGDLPWFVLEGTAVNLGAQYARAVHGGLADWVVKHAASATDASARELWARYGLEDLTKDIDEVERYQALSGFFIEHLRTTVARDAQVRFLKLMRDVSGGSTFASAFSSRLGVTVTKAKTDFEAALRARTGTARFRGTIYE